jgi:AcrR family transcriptional regulator
MPDVERKTPNRFEDAVDAPYSPKQKRSEKTYAAIIAAARELVLEGGARSLTITDVAARAGLTTGALYARFRNKDAIIEALCREMVETDRRMMEKFRAAMEERRATPAERVTEAMPLTLRVVREYAALFRLLAVDHVRTDDLRQRIVKMLEANIRMVQADFLEYRDELPHPDPELAAVMAVALTQGMMDWFLILNESGSPFVQIADEVLIEEMTRAVLGYLGLRATEEEPSQPRGSSGKSLEPS